MMHYLHPESLPTTGWQSGILSFVADASRLNVETLWSKSWG
jgi:hypothetical protein